MNCSRLPVRNIKSGSERDEALYHMKKERKDKKKYTMTITADSGLLDLNIKEVLQYRDLIVLFVKRDFTSLYKQTILGPLWAVIQPLLTTVVFTVIFGNLARLTTADVAGDFVIPGFLFYMSGNICWTYFANTVQATAGTFINNRATMGKVYYPRLVAPISTACSNLIAFGIQLFMFFILWTFFLLKGGTSIRLTPMILLIPFLILQMMMLSIGTGIIISSFTTKYRDLMHLVGFGIQLWQYGSPIAYGLELVPEHYRGLYMLNPVTPIITAFRRAVLGFGFFQLRYYLLGWGITILVFVAGLILFHRVERTFMDTI